MIRASELTGGTVRLGDDRGRVVTADVEESAHHIVVSNHGHNGLAARKLTRHVVARRAQLVNAAGILPAAPEHRAELQLQDARVGVPRRGNGGCLRERGIRVVELEESFERRLHVVVKPTSSIASW